MRGGGADQRNGAKWSKCGNLMVSVSLSVHNFQKKSPNGFKKFAGEIASKKMNQPRWVTIWSMHHSRCLGSEVEYLLCYGCASIPFFPSRFLHSFAPFCKLNLHFFPQNFVCIFAIFLLFHLVLLDEAKVSLAKKAITIPTLYMSFAEST